jgi:hypothetical protein
MLEENGKKWKNPEKGEIRFRPAGYKYYTDFRGSYKCEDTDFRGSYKCEGCMEWI